MPYIRLTVVKPRTGESDRVEELMRKLNELAAAADGCRETYLLKPHDNSGELARMAIYDSEHSAEQAASTQSVLALRSQLHLLVEPGHRERAFFTED